MRRVSDVQGSTIPTLEVRIYRDGALVQRELCESDEEANDVVDAWSEVEGIRFEIEDLTRSSTPAGVLDPRPWEVDADDATYETDPYDEYDAR